MDAGSPVVVLAAPGAGGAQVAAALAAALERPLAAWDEVADEPLGDGGELLRTACRDVLWSRERDWTCPPGQLTPADEDRAAFGAVAQLLDDGAVLHDVALPWLLPLLERLVADIHVVVVVRDPAEALPHLLMGPLLEPGEADDLQRATSARLLALAGVGGVVVADVSAGVDLASICAALVGLEPGPAVLLPVVEVHRGMEEDGAVVELRARAAVDQLVAVSVSDLLGAIADDRGAVGLERYGGPRAAARRAVLHALLGDVRGPVLECTRSRGAAAWLPNEDVSVAVVDGVEDLRRAVTLAPASQGAVLLSDVLSWCDLHDLRGALELATEVVRYGGLVAIGHSMADDEVRPPGVATPTSRQIEEAARALGLVPLPARDRDGLSLFPFAAYTAVAGTIEDLEAEVARLRDHLDRRTQQRDTAIARYDALRGRRVVRIVLGFVDAIAGVARRLRGGSRHA